MGYDGKEWLSTMDYWNTKEVADASRSLKGNSFCTFFKETQQETSKYWFQNLAISAYVFLNFLFWKITIDMDVWMNDEIIPDICTNHELCILTVILKYVTVILECIQCEPWA